MSRATKNIAKNSKYSQQQLNQIKSVINLLQCFMNQKIHQNMSIFFVKIKRRNAMKKKYGNLLSIILSGLASKKKKHYISQGWRKMQGNMIEIRAQQVRQYTQLNQEVKKKASKVIVSTLNKMYKNKLKANLKFLVSQSKAKQNAINFKIKHLTRIFNQISNRKIKEGIQQIRLKQLKMVKTKTTMRFCDKMINTKIKHYLQSAFLGLKYANKLQETNEQQISQQKQHPARRGPRIIQEAPISTPNKQQKEIDEKSRKLQNQINSFQRQKQKIINDHKKQIKIYEKQHESLKFNNDVLDKEIKDLEIELMQRQKKNVKKLSHKELWDRVYSNLLFLYSNSNGPISRQSILEALECPLSPINVDIDALKTENQVLIQLIEEYKKFYQQSHDDFIPKEDLLPYDILSAKNKFLFSTVEALIDQGIGTQTEVKKLQSDLDALIKRS